MTTKLPTRNLFMLKKIVDDDDVNGGLIMVGTFVQWVFDLTDEQVKANTKFAYRFNENSPSKLACEMRRTQSFRTTETNGTRTTFQVRIPLEVDSLFSAFPFQIMKATAAIELSSICPEGSNWTLRPDLVLHKNDGRHTISIQNIKSSDEDETIFHGIGINSKKSSDTIVDQILDKIDKSKKYNFLSPYPKVYYEYDGKKKYCPRFVVSFYAVTSGFQKMVSIILPMILVTFLTLMNVVNDIMKVDEGGNPEEATNHLQVASALTLTIVFILPQLLDDNCNREKLFTEGNLYIIFFFFSLLLTSIPISIGTRIPEIVGVSLMGASLLLPLYNCRSYFLIRKRFTEEANVSTEKKTFLKDSSYVAFEEQTGLSDFYTVEDYLVERYDNNEDSSWIDPADLVKYFESQDDETSP